ncbi:recombinase family protein [Pseudodesulfovibrio senegalensis]|uniref:Resolvase n=1 Tax=Pseudodesulfovibrio senegalensis TaxID=1721087 RepID=A0A6N6N1H2_9BACT|nr:recombinase family protein [Pseudodesulfovibrio senegalensis]KAB1441370.1 resolvase [Pseudodesulfovibrio senegalensis]
MTGRFISYLRVSTGKQARSGLGLEAQQAAVRDYLNGGDYELLEEYVEVESGKRDDRPKLKKALKHCKVTGATLIIAKLDRLSRNARFLLELQESRVQFICADMPEANDMTIQIMAVMAQHERKMISQRTKAALAAAKARGVKLGNPHGAAYIKDHGNAEAVEQIKRDAQDRAEDLRDVVEDIQNCGTTSVRGIAAELTARGIRTARGGKWHPTSVARLLKRIQ